MQEEGPMGCPGHGWDGDTVNLGLEGSLGGCFLKDGPFQEARAKATMMGQ